MATTKKTGGKKTTTKKKTTPQGALPNNVKLEEGQLIQVLSGLRVRLDAANAQLIQLGLLVEYLYERLELAEGVDVNSEAFPEWAKKRYEEIQTAAQQAMKDGLMDTFKEQQKEVEKEINLSDE